MNQGSGDYPHSKPGQLPEDSQGRKTEDAGSGEPGWGEGPDLTSDIESAFEEATTPVDVPPQESDAAAEIQKLRARLADKEAQISKVMEAYRRLKKENQRFRQRMEQSQKRHIEKSKNEFIGQFVDVLDNLDRAIESIENNFDSDSVLQGIILLRSRLVQLLRQEGLEKIFVGGQPFDPTHSEAAAVEPVATQADDNIVIRELQRGYMLKGALLRPARVVVGRFSGPPQASGGLPSNDSPDSSSSES